jgi:hypothetical protein
MVWVNGLLVGFGPHAVRYAVGSIQWKLRDGRCGGVQQWLQGGGCGGEGYKLAVR